MQQDTSRRHDRIALAFDVVLWLAGSALLTLAVHLKDPLLLAFRAWETAGLTGLGLGGIVVVLARSCRRHGPGRWMLLAVWLAVPAVTLVQEMTFRAQRHTVETAVEAEARALGRHFIVGYTDVGEVTRLAARGLIGGVFITQRNAAGRSVDTLREEVAALQAIRRSSGLPPLIVATDQEGGMVSRLSPPLSRQPPLATIAALPLEMLAGAAYDYGARQGRELASVGVTVDFAPVLDLRPALPRDRFDFHSRIAQRAIAADPDVVAEVGLAYANGLADAGIIATLKHFPGLGRVAADTHHFSARLDTTPEELAATDWLPFRRLAALATVHIMIGHVTLTAVDPDRPASRSRRVVQQVLRGSWGFRGLLVTDDLTMGAVYRRGLCAAAVDALNAGIDLLLVAYDGEQYYRAIACALEARRTGRLDAAMLAESDARLRAQPALRYPDP